MGKPQETPTLKVATDIYRNARLKRDFKTADEILPVIRVLRNTKSTNEILLEERNEQK